MDIKVAIKHLRISFPSVPLPLPSPFSKRRNVATIFLFKEIIFNTGIPGRSHF